MTTQAHHTPATQGVGSQSSLSKMNAGVLGMVLFIGSEVMFFGAFFTAYFIARSNSSSWPPHFQGREPFEGLPQLLTGANTALLVFSSLTVWWAEKRMRAGDRKGLRRGLILTILLGLTFLLVQINEYAHLPFTPQDTIFGTTFYMLTGLHGLHVFIGLCGLTFCYMRARAGEFSHGKDGALVATSIYWHFVDVVWVFLFVVVYLV